MTEILTYTIESESVTPPGPPVAGAIDLPERLAARVFTRLRTIAAESGNPSVEDIARWIAAQLQDAENAVIDIRNLAPLATAEGYQLDLHAAALGLVRSGLDDDAFRPIVIAVSAALTHRRRTPELVRAILSTLTSGTDSTFTYEEFYPAAFEIGLFDIDAATAAIWVDAVARAKLEGVRMTSHVVADTTNAFRFDTVGFGFDQGREFSYTLEP